MTEDMAEKTVLFDALSDSAKHTALVGFAKFYIEKYYNEGLDLLAQIDVSGHVADINQWLIDNDSFLKAEKLDGLVADRGDNMAALLVALKAPFTANGQPETPWNTWFKDEIGQAQQGR
ncbi:hypothetical protein [Lacticaseibacillus salsurivasis]|uniref:hypothetical protein n=1 Tax=Lacticaseibacillus salsurivasis TaxID=3081441 RepID=UPI0030C735DA